MNSVTDWLVQNRDKIEMGVKIIGQASEVLASTVGQLHPILEAVFVASAELLNNPDSEDARYLVQQFDLVNKQLDGIRSQLDNINLAMQRSSMNKQNFDYEVHMLSQYDKFQDFVNAKPNYKNIKKEKFLKHYEVTGGDRNLDAIYYAVTGENMSGVPMLQTVVETERRSRRAVENFCARLKKLFMVGIIAVMGRAALKEGTVDGDMVKKWQLNMEEVERRMKAAVNECTEKFAEQAKMDLEQQLQESTGTVDQEFTKSLLETLVKKYDWVQWSIRAFAERERIFFFNWLAGKNYHGSGGANWFDILTKNKIKLVISFCADPKPINKQEIQEQVELLHRKGNMVEVAQALHKSFPTCLVHAVSQYKVVVETNNFQEGCYYYGKHKRASVCIHPEGRKLFSAQHYTSACIQLVIKAVCSCVRACLGAPPCVTRESRDQQEHKQSRNNSRLSSVNFSSLRRVDQRSRAERQHPTLNLETTAKMADQLQKLVADKKDMVENVMEVFEQGAEVVASIAGDLFPIFSIAAPIVKLALDNVESKEAAFMKEQFQKVRDRLEVISEEIQRINDEIKKSGMDATYFSAEENITNQFRKYMDILNAKPKFREVKKKLFLEHFAKTGGDKNLNMLYNAVTGENFSGESILEITLNYEEKSRRPTEDFCARLKKLFCIGLIALLGHAALKGYEDEEEALLKNWGEKMKSIQVKMNAVIEDCIESFPKQAELDARRLVRDQTGLTNQQLADAIVEKLKKKYDWVGWSVRVFPAPSGLFANKKDFHCPTGKSRFQVPASDEKLNVWVSYSSSAEPVDKPRVRQLVQGQKKLAVVGVAEALFELLPGDCVVHTVKTSKDLACAWSFTDELHYWEEHKKLHVCVHSA